MLQGGRVVRRVAEGYVSRGMDERCTATMRCAWVFEDLRVFKVYTLPEEEVK